jgi:hypothetical protein
MISGSSSYRSRRTTFDAAAAQAWAESLARDLVAPPLTLGVDELTRLWLAERVSILCRRPRDFADYPELSVRIRGAFGRSLATISPRSADGWSRPSAFSVLFAPAGKWAAGLELPKPFVIRARASRDTIIVELSLFGHAGVFTDEAVEALRRALARGIAISPEAAMRIPLEIVSESRSRMGGLQVFESARAASLVFRTPVAVRTRDQIRSDPSSIMRSVLLRVSGMARWQGVSLAADWLRLHRVIDALDANDSELTCVRWRRYSLRRGDSAIPMTGWLGPLRFGGRLNDLAPYLAIAETCNVGSHASLGLGWFDLSMA